MMRRVHILALVLLASCTSAGSGGRPTGPGAAGGPVTNAPGSTQAIAERGVGGTGIAPQDAVADRGMGGTGIVGVVTGFGSIWVNGIEVEFDPNTPVQVDGRPARSHALQVGQVAVITATGSGAHLKASAIAIRHEVAGPVEAVDATGTVLRVAGQRVRLTGAVWGDSAPQPGDWVAVSGFAEPDGGIVATRIDKRDPGRIVVHGSLSGSAAAPHIGTLALRPTTRLSTHLGKDVTVSGRYVDGMLVADDVSQDALATDPAGWFDRSVSRLVIESYADAGRREFGWGHGLDAAAAGILGSLGTQPQRVIIEFQRRPGGGLDAVGLRSTIGRTGTAPEPPRGIGDERQGFPGSTGPGGRQTPPGSRDQSSAAPAGPTAGRPPGGSDLAYRRSDPMFGSGCGGGGMPGGGCAPAGSFGHGRHGGPGG